MTNFERWIESDDFARLFAEKGDCKHCLARKFCDEVCDDRFEKGATCFDVLLEWLDLPAQDYL